MDAIISLEPSSDIDLGSYGPNLLYYKQDEPPQAFIFGDYN